MKTAIIKTNIWDDDDFFELNIDTKLLYLLLLSSPERGVSDVYKVSDRILSARSGLTMKQLEICKRQLQDAGLVVFADRYVKLGSASYVRPRAGRFTKSALSRELSDIPADVMDQLGSTDENLQEEYKKNTSAALVHKDIDKDIDKDRDNDIDNDKDVNSPVEVHGKPEINELFAYWQDHVGYAIESRRQRNRNACSNLVKKYGTDGVETLIRTVSKSQTDRYAPRISDFESLQARCNELLAWVKRSSVAPKVVEL